MTWTATKVWLTTLGGWFLYAAAAVVSYVSAPAACVGWARLNVIESPVGIALTIAALGFFGLAAWGVYAVTDTEKTNRVWTRWLALMMGLAIVSVPFNTHDLSFYFSAGKAAAGGANVFIDTWSFANQFSCNAETGSMTGIMYGPLAVGLFKTVYAVAGGSFTWFVLVWKLVMAGGLWALYGAIKKELPQSLQTWFGLWLFTQPLIMWEWVSAGHFDGLWVLTTVWALVAAKRNQWVVAALALAVGVWLKFIPILVAPWLLLWWYQSLTASNWRERLWQALGAVGVIGLVTYVVWQPIWHGAVTVAPIILQTKWAVSSWFAAIYYACKGLAVVWWGDNAHRILTRLVHAFVFSGALYFLWPLAQSVWLVLRRKLVWQPGQFYHAIFITLLVYLAIWQKSFWPWYVSWLLPLGVLALVLRAKSGTQIMRWLSVMPLGFYAVWLLNHILRGTDAPSELWFYWVVVVLVWAGPLAWLWQWRREKYLVS